MPEPLGHRPQHSSRSGTVGCKEESAQTPLNVRLGQVTSLPLRIRPRPYQDELYKIALQENVIVFLGTGLGKTFITVLYINSPEIDEQIQRGRKVVFLAPTQQLIKQQAEYNHKLVPYKMKIFCGSSAHVGLQIDHWDAAIWRKELSQVDLLFMTPEIFKNALATNLLSWENFAAIIFDECHHACRSKRASNSGTPYHNILKHYQTYYANRPDQALNLRPRIIGLTASLVNSMPTGGQAITDGVLALEKLFSGRCVTNIEVIESRPTMISHSYVSFEYTAANDVLTNFLINFKNKLNEVLKNDTTGQISRNQKIKIRTYHERLALAARGLSIKPVQFPDVINGLLVVRQRTGIWALEKVCTKIVEALDKPSARDCLSQDTKVIYSAFTETIRLLALCLNRFLRVRELEECLLKFTNPKPLCLLDVLRREWENFQLSSNERKTFSTIVFVRSRLEVVAIHEWLAHVSTICSRYSFIKSDYALGIAATMSSKYSCITKRSPREQDKMLDDFRNGLKNVIVTTAVLEEGIDLPVCSTVIRYDLPQNFREYVQSRGRARQRDASFVAIVEESNRPKAEENLVKLNDFEVRLRKFLSDHDVKQEAIRRRQEAMNARRANEASDAATRSLHETDLYIAREGAIRIGPACAKTILSMYCNLLARSTPFSEGVRRELTQPTPLTYQTTIFMPSGCPLSEGIVGNEKASPDNADNSAVIEALKALIKRGELAENGTPFRINEETIDELLDEHKLKPVYEQIVDDDQVGLGEGEEERKYYKHKPRVRTLNDYISRDHLNKSYCMVPVKFRAADNNVRHETRAAMEKEIFGLIFESCYDTSFIPEFIHTHYGKFEVQFKRPTKSFLIHNPDHHRAYLNYNHKLLVKCLGISAIKCEEFRYHCQLYVVPLNDRDEPDMQKMRESFNQTQHQLRVGNVVKLRQIFTPSVGPAGRNNSNSNKNKDFNKKFVVRAIRTDLDARSPVPHKNINFIQDAEYRYGEGIVTRLDQPVIEVMPLSNEFGRTDAGKKRSADYRTSGLFYLSQFLEFFNEDAATVMQSYNMPEIIYRMYNHVVTAELDRKFVAQTQEYRTATAAAALVQLPATTGGELSVAGSAAEERPEEQFEVPDADSQDANEDDDDDDDSEHDEPTDANGNDGEDDLAGSDDEDGSDDDYDSDSELIESHKKMILTQRLELNDDGGGDMERWDFSEYKETDLAKFEFQRRAAPMFDLDIDRSIRLGDALPGLEAQLSPLVHDLLNKLERYEAKLLNQTGSLDEGQVLGGDHPRVDRSIQAPVMFVLNKPLKDVRSRVLALQESLTLKKARQGYDLEALENVGDSYLKYLVSVVAYQNLEGSEGILTTVRSRLTSNKNFTYLARKSKLGTYAISQPFSKERLAYALGQEIRGPEDLFMSRLRSKDLADVFEAVVGSYLVYHGQFEAILALKWLGLDLIKESTFAELSQNRVAFARPASALDTTSALAGTRIYDACVRKMSRVEKILGYQFRDPSFLVQAFTHASYMKKCTRSYERLEFQGDAILDFLTTMTLFQSGKIQGPGQMTASRSAIVNNGAFARLSLKYKFDQYLMYFNHEIYDEIVRVRTAIEDDPNLGCFDLVEFDGIVKLLGDLFESVAGAIYLDSGCSLDSVWSVYYPMMKENIDRELACPSKNLTVMLYETFPGQNRVSFESYDVKTKDGDLVGVKCFVQGFGEFEGRGQRRAQAKQRAIQAAMAKPPSEEERKRLNQDYLRQNPHLFVARPASSSSRGARGGGRGRGGAGGRGGQRGRGGYSGRGRRY